MFIALVSENSAWGKNQWEFLFGSGFNVLSNFGISFGNPHDVCSIWAAIPCTYTPYKAQYTPSMVGFIYTFWYSLLSTSSVIE